MKRTRTIPWNPVEQLSSDEEITAYFEAALVEGEPKIIAAALDDIAVAQRIKCTSSVARGK